MITFRRVAPSIAARAARDSVPPPNQLSLAIESPVAQRQPKTDRLILAKLLQEKAADFRLDQQHMQAAHAILVKWAEMETKGRLAKLSEPQLQDDFLAQVWGEALASGVAEQQCLTRFPHSRHG